MSTPINLDSETADEITELLAEFDKAKERFKFADNYLYKVATEETREECFNKMLKLLRIVKGELP